ncbi:DUF4250 domain-containing protein [Ruminobacter sp. RM87]|uniref:DUF4250 domain-containing protein n=1 Tax=Ruminobacter sp. RM87 TaxID=1200567 RepID=UPI0004E1F5F5|nr:DUF4250 domain-containing protein [Ruminobacter sp. RM87]
MAFENLSKMDPYILLSIVNMKLRDFDDHDLDSFCATYEINREELEKKLKDAGFEYDPETNQFK